MYKSLHLFASVWSKIGTNLVMKKYYHANQIGLNHDQELSNEALYKVLHLVVSELQELKVKSFNKDLSY